MGRADSGQEPQPLYPAAGLLPVAEQFHGRGRQQYRCMAHGFGAASQYQVGASICDVSGSTVDSLHARAAVALDGPGWHLLAAAEPERYQAGDIDLVGAGDDAAEDYLVQRFGCKGLP